MLTVVWIAYPVLVCQALFDAPIEGESVQMVQELRDPSRKSIDRFIRLGPLSIGQSVTGRKTYSGWFILMASPSERLAKVVSGGPWLPHQTLPFLKTFQFTGMTSLKAL